MRSDTNSQHTNSLCDHLYSNFGAIEVIVAAADPLHSDLQHATASGWAPLRAQKHGATGLEEAAD